MLEKHNAWWSQLTQWISHHFWSVMFHGVFQHTSCCFFLLQFVVYADQRFQNLHVWSPVKIFLLVVQRFGVRSTFHGFLAQQSRVQGQRTLQNIRQTKRFWSLRGLHMPEAKKSSHFCFCFTLSQCSMNSARFSRDCVVSGGMLGDISACSKHLISSSWCVSLNSLQHDTNAGLNISLQTVYKLVFNKTRILEQEQHLLMDEMKTTFKDKERSETYLESWW